MEKVDFAMSVGQVSRRMPTASHAHALSRQQVAVIILRYESDRGILM